MLFIFQQDSDPAHRTHETVNFLDCRTPAFITPNSPDLRLNLADYKIWGIIQQWHYHTKCKMIWGTIWLIVDWNITQHYWRCHWPVMQTFPHFLLS